MSTKQVKTQRKPNMALKMIKNTDITNLTSKPTTLTLLPISPTKRLIIDPTKFTLTILIGRKFFLFHLHLCLVEKVSKIVKTTRINKQQDSSSIKFRKRIKAELDKQKAVMEPVIREIVLQMIMIRMKGGDRILIRCNVLISMQRKIIQIVNDNSVNIKAQV